MARISKLLDFDLIVGINQVLIYRTGGRYVEETKNLHNAGSLLYACDAIDEVVFGVELCPTVCDKAAKLGWTIIKEHVFTDGNKRTGMFVANLYLRISHHRVTWDRDEAIGIALDIAEGRLGEHGFSEWLKSNSVQYAPFRYWIVEKKKDK